MRNIPICIVGATGLVGGTLLSLLEQRDINTENLFLLASEQSAGKQLVFRDGTLVVSDLKQFDFSRCKIAFFCVGNDLAEEYIPKATAQGAIVIDKSFFYRNHPDVPLIIPEVNADAIAGCKKLNIIANPNCNTIPIAVGLKPIYDAVGITRINVATYQSVSGTGKEAVGELHDQASQLLASQEIMPRVYPKQIAFNVLPHIDDFLENGYTREEMKMVWELKKIFNDTHLVVNPTAVRVPVFYGHSAAVNIETKAKLTANDAIMLLKDAPGIKLITGELPYATPAGDAAGFDEVFIGRVREDISHPKGLNLWIVADNLRKGAALNALQIADQLIERYL